MGGSRRTEFAEADVRVADLARALAHPARIAILRILAERRGCICGELVDALPLAQSTISQHLKELREVGLISGEVAGPRTCYCLAPAALAECFDLLSALGGALQGKETILTAEGCGC